MINSRTTRVSQGLIRALLIFAVVLSFTGCDLRLGGIGGQGFSVYEPFLGTYRGVLQRQGNQNATVILELSFGDAGFVKGGRAQLSVVSASGARYTFPGGWGPKANNTMQAGFGTTVHSYVIMFVLKEKTRLIAIATSYPKQITSDWYGPFDGLVLVKQ